MHKLLQIQLERDQKSLTSQIRVEAKRIILAALLEGAGGQEFIQLMRTFNTITNLELKEQALDLKDHEMALKQTKLQLQYPKEIEALAAAENAAAAAAKAAATAAESTAAPLSPAQADPPDFSDYPSESSTAENTEPVAAHESWPRPVTLRQRFEKKAHQKPVSGNDSRLTSDQVPGGMKS